MKAEKILEPKTSFRRSSTLIFKNYSEADLLGWAHEKVKKPWEHMCEVAALAAAGKPIPADKSTVEIPLTPFRVDYRGAFYLMRDGVNLLIGEPCNLFTIILSSDRKRILKAYLEEARLNNFISLTPLDPQGAWAPKALEMIESNDTHYLTQYLNEYFLKERNLGVNWVKIANIQFFGPFRDVLERFEENRSFRDLLEGYWDAIKKAYAEKWIEFLPEPHIFARIREVIHEEIIQYNHAHLPSGEIPEETGEEEHPSEPRVVLGLVGRDYKVAINLSLSHPYELVLNQDMVESYHGNDLKGFARHLSEKTGAPLSLALAADPALNLLYEYLSRPFPLRRLDMFILYRKLFTFIKNFGTWWSLAPRPFFLKERIRFWGKLVGYDITRLPDQDLPDLLVDGLGLAGLSARYALIVVDGDKPFAAIIFEFFDGAIRKISTFPIDKLEPAFAGMGRDRDDLRERLFRAKQIMWTEDGWVNFAFAVQKDLINAIFDFLFKRSLTSIPKLIGSMGDIRLMLKLMKGGIAMCPDFILQRIKPWVKKKGRFNIYPKLIQAAFEGKWKKPRGLLYVRSTIIVVAILSLLVLGLIFLVG